MVQPCASGSTTQPCSSMSKGPSSSLTALPCGKGRLCCCSTAARASTIRISNPITRNSPTLRSSSTSTTGGTVAAIGRPQHLEPRHLGRRRQGIL